MNVRVFVQHPRFCCETCGSSLGASRDSEDAPWKPAACYVCEHRTKTRAAAKQRREQPRVLGGVDVDLAVAGLRKLPVFRDHKLLRRRRKILVEVGHRAEESNGHAIGRKIRVAAAPGTSAARVLEIIIHELCHLAARRHHHDERFRRVFQRAVREAWQIDVPIDAARGEHHNVSYAMGGLVVAALEQRIAAGLIETYPPAPKKPAPSKAARMEAIVEKRREHALTMYERAERRAKTAQRTLTKWRQKVRYYERAAARKAAP